LEAVLPEFRVGLVIAGVRNALWRVAAPQQNEAPASDHELALAILALLDDGRHVAGEDRRHRLEGGGAVVRDAEEPRHGIALLVEGIEIAHRLPPEPPSGPLQRCLGR